MGNFMPDPLHKKILVLIMLVLFLGMFSKAYNSNATEQEIKGASTTNPGKIRFIPLNNERSSGISFISLDEYRDRAEITNIKKLYVNTDPNFKQKVKNIENYMNRRNSPPLTEKTWYMVAIANKYEIDYRLVPAISIIESSGGAKLYRPYNAWGWGGAKGFTFNSWEESIYTVTSGIARGYYARGATTPRQMAPAYNPHTPNEWGRKVEMVMEQIGPPL